MKDKKYYLDVYKNFWKKCLDDAEKELIEYKLCVSTYLQETATDIFEETANAEAIIGYYIFNEEDEALNAWLINTNGLDFTKQDKEIDIELKRLYVNDKIEKLKLNKEYSFECNINKEDFENETCHDEWGAAFVWFGEICGVEYNFCVDNDVNYCAIYKLKCKPFQFETDYNSYEHYEIDFSKENWKEELENAMCKALINFFDLWRFDL